MDEQIPAGAIPVDQFVPDSPPLAMNGEPPPGAIPVDQFVSDEEKYSSLGQQVGAGAEGFARGLISRPGVALAEKAGNALGIPGLSPEDQEGRERVNPIKSGLGEAAGFGTGLLTGTGEARVLEGLGEGAGKLAGLAEPASALAKIGSGAVRGITENTAFGAQDEIGKMINGQTDPTHPVQTALVNVGLNGLLGGVLGGTAGGASALWESTLGPKAGSILQSISDRVGGIEGVSSQPIDALAAKTGMEISPELRAATSEDPAIKQMASTLAQSDTTKSGQAFQETLRDFHEQAGNTLSESLAGKTPDRIPEDFDKYSHGRSIGNTLAEEFRSQVDPLAKTYDEIAGKYQKAELAPSLADRAESSASDLARAGKDLDRANRAAVKAQATGDPGAAIEAAAKVEDAQSKLVQLQKTTQAPGTTDVLSEKLGQLADREKWTLSPSSDIMREVNRVQKELPGLKSVSDLSAYIKRVGENMQSDPLNGPLLRAGGMIKSVLRDSESELIGNHIGSEEGAAALEKYRGVQKAYAAQSDLREQLDSRLHIKGSTSGYAARLSEMAQTDGESLFRKLSGKDDADLLSLLQDKFPKTAEKIRQAQMEQLLSKAKSGDGIDAGKVLKSIKQLSPQQKEFLIPAQAASRVDAIGSFIEQLKDRTQNFSNTGRTIDKLFQYIPGSAVGLASMVMGHNPGVGLALGALTKYVAKDAPDAVRLAALKWLGAGKPIDLGGFKSMVDFIQHTIQGEATVNDAAKALFNVGSKVIPEHLIPNDKDTHALDKKLQNMQMHPQPVDHVASKAGYYLPNHGIAMAATAQNASNYLNSIRPATVRPSPLGRPIEPNSMQKAQFNRALQIAQQPLMVMKFAKEGTLTAADMTHVNSLYSGLSQRISSKIMDEMVKNSAADKLVPFQTRMGLSLLLGQQLDSALSTQSIQSNQTVFNAANQVTQAKQAGAVKPSMTGLSKLNVSQRTSLNPSEDG